jgi:hypothetical protein
MQPPNFIPNHLYAVLSLTLALALLACSGPVVSATDTTADSSDTTDTGPPDTPTPTTSATGSTSTTDGGPLTAGTTLLTSNDPTDETTASSASESAGSTGEIGLCGNSILDDGEGCDFGANNWDFGACTSQCQSARCGDGLLFAGVEACDEADANGPGYGKCLDCQFGPRCGDGVLTPGFEQCDGGDPDGGSPDGAGEIEGADTPCEPGCTWQGRVIFISSEPTPAALGGITGADLRCQNLAKAAGLVSYAGFRTWLSDADDSPATRLAFGPEPLVLLNGVLVAEDLDALIADGPGDGITVTEQRTTLTEVFVWTNTDVIGEVFSEIDHCENWTSAGSDPGTQTGINAVPKLPADAWNTWRDERRWTSHKKWKCSFPAHLYCIEDAAP